MSNKRKRVKYNHKSKKHKTKSFRVAPKNVDKITFKDRLNELMNADINTPDTKWEKVFTYVIYTFLIIGAPVIGCFFGIFMFAKARDADSETKNYRFIGKLSMVLLALYILAIVILYVLSWFGIVQINM